MSRPVRKLIEPGLPGWDAEVDDNLSALYNAPFPLFMHTGTLASLTSAFPPDMFEYCLCVLDDTVSLEQSIYFSKDSLWNQLAIDPLHTHAAYALNGHPHTAAQITSGTLNVTDAIEWDGAVKTVSSSPPSGGSGSNGDIHFELE